MFSAKANGWWLRGAAGAATAGACLVAACTADIPSGPGAGPAVNAAASTSDDEQEFAYEVAVLDRAPQLSNARSIGGIMEKLYPSLLQNAGIGGTVVTQFVIQPDGTPDQSSIKVLKSEREELSAASVAAVRAFTFRPGQYKGENVRVLIQLPITWQPRSAVASSDGTRVVGEGTFGTSARPGLPVARAADFDAHEVSSLDTPPRLLFTSELGALMERHYPAALRSAGIGGTVIAQYVVQPDGKVDLSTAKVLESPNPELGAATLKALAGYQFKPGVYRGENVRTLIQMPFTWQP